MNFNEYQEKAVSTAVFRSTEEEYRKLLLTLSLEALIEEAVSVNNLLRLAYLGLGLNGEAGEVAEKLKKMVRDDHLMTSEKREAIKKELGDVLWYVSGVAHEAQLNMEDIAKANIEKLFDRKERGVLGGSGDNR